MTLDNTIEVFYVRGDDLISQWRKSDGSETVSYYGHDAHGSTVILTDSGGVATDHWFYDAWGNIVARDGSTVNLYRYTGQQQDGTGLYYLRARHYSPTLTRFLQRDPVEGSVREPLSLHLYCYCVNNAVNRVDPSGLQTMIGQMTTMQAISIIARALLTVNLKLLPWGFAVGGLTREAFHFISRDPKDWEPWEAIRAFAEGAALGTFGCTLIGGWWLSAQGIMEATRVLADPRATDLECVFAMVTGTLCVLSGAFLIRQGYRTVAHNYSALLRRPRAVLRSAQIGDLKSFHRSNLPGEVGFGKYRISYEPSLPPDSPGMTWDTAGYHIGPAAFVNDETLVKTILEENIHLYRRAEGFDPLAYARGTAQAEDAQIKPLVNAIYKLGGDLRWW